MEPTAWPSSSFVLTTRILLRGIAQVMFQPHAGTGLLFVIGLAVGSPLVAFGALLGSAIGTGVASLLKFDAGELEDGIYGFNSALVGLALLVLLQPAPATWGLIVVGTALASVVTRLARRFLPFPTYTAPFVVVTWGALLLAHATVGKSLDKAPPPSPPASANFLEAVLAGEAEVMLGSSVLTGALFVAGIALSDWRHAILAVLGSVTGTMLSHYHNDPLGSIAVGIYGYNGALAAMAIWLSRPSLAIAILAAIITVPLTEFFPKSLGIPALTAPFVLGTWIVLAINAIDPYFIQRTRNDPGESQG